MRKARGGRLPSPVRDGAPRRHEGASAKAGQIRGRHRRGRKSGRPATTVVEPSERCGRAGKPQLPVGYGKRGRRRARHGPVQTAAGTREKRTACECRHDAWNGRHWREGKARKARGSRCPGQGRRGAREARPAGDGPFEHWHRERDAPPAGHRPPRRRQGRQPPLPAAQDTAFLLPGPAQAASPARAAGRRTAKAGRQGLPRRPGDHGSLSMRSARARMVLA